MSEAKANSTSGRKRRIQARDSCVVDMYVCMCVCVCIVCMYVYMARE